MFYFLSSHSKHHFDPQAKPFFESSLAPPMKSHFEPLPVVPLKILAHNELVGRVIGEREAGGPGGGRGDITNKHLLVCTTNTRAK